MFRFRSSETPETCQETSPEQTTSNQSYTAKILELCDFQISNLEDKLKLKTMIAVQKQSIPHILHGRDVLVKFQTGSG